MRFLLSVLLLCFVTFNGDVPECNELENGAVVANDVESNVDTGITSTIVSEADNDQRVVQPQEVCVFCENMIQFDSARYIINYITNSTHNFGVKFNNYETEYTFSDWKISLAHADIAKTIVTTEYGNQLGPLHRWIMA